MARVRLVIDQTTLRLMAGDWGIAPLRIRFSMQSGMLWGLLFGLVMLSACGTPRQAPVYTVGAARPTSYDPPGPPGDPWGPYINEASQRFDIPQRWIREVMRQESGGRVSATSPVGAMGLMQVMPGTYAELRGRHGLGSDPYHPWDSIMAGTAYLRQMYDLYGSPAFLAAYNAGPRRLEDYLWNGRGLPNETRNYVSRIGPRIADEAPRRRAAPEIYAAAEIPLSIPAGPRRMDAGTMLALRDQRSRAEPAIQVASLPPGPVVRMEPIPDGSTYAATDPLPPPNGRADRVQIASLDGGPVMRMDPIVSAGDFAPTSIGRIETTTLAPPVAATGLARPPAAAPRGGLGALPLAAPQPAAPVSTGRAPGGTRLVLTSPSPPPPPRGLSLVPQAAAGSLPGGLRAPAPSGAWAVQVGAFSSEQQARGAAAAARDSAGQPSARPAVTPVAQGRATLWRARVTGLSRENAAQVCGRMRERGSCMVVSPEG